ncbi:UNVERIFIED_ORG: type I restriction enzyme S subunit [Pantoea allii]|uniref:restriction endonuclease subunit S n=1 Tax=Enterobacter agglomerans TaxID=549 RepID=UPI001066DC9B
MSADNKVPEIRFEGFSGEWVERSWSDTVYISTNMVDPRNCQYGELFHVGPGNIESFTGRFYNNVLKVKDSNLISGKFHFNKGDIIYGKINPQLAKYVIAPFEGLASADAYVLNTQNGVVQNYLFAILHTEHFYKYTVSVSSRTGMPKINRDELNIYNYMAPSESEQTQIGNYFQKLNALINQHQQKHDKLSSIKKAMLEKMFPKPSETLPEIRFKGFSGEWEKKELGELAEIVRGASPRPIEDPKWFDSQSSVGWLRIRDVTEQDGRIHYLEQRISKLGQEKTRVLHEKHLLLSIAASVGKPVVNYVETGVHDGFLIFKKPLFELEFMYQWLKSFETKWQQFGQPGSQVNLNSDIVKNLIVTIPTNEEQTVIGNYFQKLDALINQHQQQITKINNIKQACLSKMFV